MNWRIGTLLQIERVAAETDHDESDHSMPVYDLVVHCGHCGNEHPLQMRIYLVDIIEQKQSIAELFRGRAAPPQLSAIKAHTALCLKTGKKFKLEEDERIFLVLSSFFPTT